MTTTEEPVSAADTTTTTDIPATTTKFIAEVDVSGDGGIIKKIIREGHGDSPKQGQNVHVHYVGRLLDGTVFDSSRDREEEFEFELGRGQVIKGWDQGVATMKQGELALLVCKPEYAYGATGSPPKIPPNATLEFEVELLSFEDKEKYAWEMTAEEKLEAGLKRKEEGNALFKQGDYKAAIQKYEKAITYYEEDSDASEEEGKKLKEGNLVCLLNAAMCHLKLKEYKNAIESCTKALKIDPNSVKALYRRGVAYSDSAEYELAEKDFKQALEVSPGNKEVLQAQAELKKRVAQYRSKEAKMFKNMFEKLSSERSD
eukprot:GEZU01029177.1.p1 GENE.GEZU01029177.1~~GEZU01029177.1.p1  ORF type:complete len:315 (-),score=151.96 GEZU01029177.1:99-1043(-)